jgi:hypothetical protein
VRDFENIVVKIFLGVIFREDVVVCRRRAAPNRADVAICEKAIAAQATNTASSSADLAPPPVATARHRTELDSQVSDADAR